MKKILHYSGNIAEIIIAFVLYGVLQMLYFAPKAFEKRYHLPMQGFSTALITVIVMAFIFWMYKKQLQEVNNWGFNEEPHWRIRKILISIIGFFMITILGAMMLQVVGMHGANTSNNQQQLNMISKQSGNLLKLWLCLLLHFVKKSFLEGCFSIPCLLRKILLISG